jgi:ComF family protein
VWTSLVNGRFGPRPPRWPCELCGDAAGTVGICAPCRADLPWIGSACPGCARPVSMPAPCAECAALPRPWSAVVAPLAWRFPVDALVARFKYAGALHFGALLGRLLASCCAGRMVDGVVPVPLHHARLAERGFNQAAELARPLAAALGVPLLDGIARRVLATPPQAGLPAAGRRRNLAGAFVAGQGAGGLRLAIVDDVFTTGSTAEGLARALLDAGAVGIEVWTVARGGTAQAGA